MLIGIEAERANIAQKTGVEHYAKQLILHLAKIDRQNSYVLYLRTPPELWFGNLPGNFQIKVIPFPIFWTQLRLSWEMLFHPVDALFIPASALPFIHPKNSVSTIHDLAWDFFPETYTKFNRYFLRFFTWFAVKFCRKIIAVSQATKHDLIKKYRVEGDKVAVVHHGYEVAKQSQVSALDSSTMKKIPQDFVLFLSTLQPRKNLQGLIRAFEQLQTQGPRPEKLLVVGRPGWKYKSILADINSHSNLVVYLNHVSDDERLEILRRAKVLVLPSFYEGFGMQILEAFSLGVPVATAKVSSMPEVAGEAAVYFDPNNTSEIKHALQILLNDSSLRTNLIAKGRQRLQNFSWDKCARETLTVLTKV